jgi:hypothetical protein
LRTAWEASHAAGEKAAAFTRDDLLTRKTWPAARVEELLAAATLDGLVFPVGLDRYEFTAAGQDQALAAVRGQRLWQAFLTAFPEAATSTANLASPSVDQYVSPAVVAKLTSELKAAGRWPEASA